MFDVLLGKYRNIIVSIALFLLLDTSVLMLNFYMSFEISADAAGVNLAGRQRMLSQRMVKSLFDIEYSLLEPDEKDKALAELKSTVMLFDATFKAFENGGNAMGADGSSVNLEAVTTGVAIQSLRDAKGLWEPYQESINLVLFAEDNYTLAAALSRAISAARTTNLPLLKLMNDLTVELEAVASSKASRLRIIQTVGISLAIINFFIIMFHFLRQLREGDRKLEEARNETIEILETVNEGLFLIDANLTVGGQYSAAMESMFARKDIGGKTFEALLEDVVSDKNLGVAKRFIALLFRAEIKSNLVHDLNPLSEIEVNIANESGQFVSKYFSFAFERVYEGDVIQDVLVTVSDVTDRVVLQRELEATKEQNEKQIEILTSILHANPDLLAAFVETVFNSAKYINSILKERSKSVLALKKKLNDIFIEVHKIKGEASALGLESFEQLAHEFELNVIKLKDRDDLSGDDFLPLVVALEKIAKHCESVQALTEKLSAFASKDIQGNESSGKDWSHLNNLALKISERAGKNVLLVTSGLSELPLPESLRSLVGDIAIQGIRNSIAHGIEAPEERLEMHKPVHGRIDVRLSSASNGAVELSIKDDGYGIDVQRIREKAIASGNWSELALESWDAKKITSLIFEPGFTTSDVHSVDSGSGMGMDVIKSRVNAMRGKIRVHSRRGVGTKISVVFPSLERQVEVA